MIVSHKYRFVIAVPAGMGCGPWLRRIMEEGPEGYLEIVGHANDVVVPLECKDYDRFFVDAPQARLPRMYVDRIGKPWEGSEAVEAAGQRSTKRLEAWLDWYCLKMRPKFRHEAADPASGPNGWGMRGEHGEWAYFEHPSTLARTFAGIGNSDRRADAPWGRKMPRFVKLEEYTRGWRDVLKKMYGDSQEAKDARELIKWHVPEMETFYEIRPDLASLFLREGAWNFKNTIKEGIFGPK